MEAFQIKHISSFIILRFSTHSDGKFIRGKNALFTALLDGPNLNGYAENLPT
jgi:hypothetical protein